ncbi:MAG: AI-2E family transporter [Chloroflexota bacterium]
MQPDPRSAPWGAPTKLLVTLIGLVLVAALLVRFQAIIPPLVVAGIVTYLVLPIIRWLHLKARLSWALATNLFFLILLLQLIAGLAAAGLAALQQLQGLFLTVEDFLLSLPVQIAALTQQTLALGPLQLDLARYDLTPLVNQLLAAIQPALGRISSLLTSLATGALEVLAKLLLVLAVSYFLTLDHERLRVSWSGLSVPGAEEDLRRLRLALGRIWHSFLRGQLLVVLATGILMGTLMTALGVRFSLGLGLLGGLSKFVPIIGPATAGAVAALVTLFQPSNWYGLSPVSHAILVIIAIVVLDQSIDYLLLPRIMSSSLNLHPVLVIVGAIVGASLAGVIGLLLSAPATATLLLLGRFAYRKLVDLSPWDPPIDAPPPRPAARWWLRLLRRLRRAQDPPA